MKLKHWKLIKQRKVRDEKRNNKKRGIKNELLKPI